MIYNPATDILLINSADQGDLHHMADYPYGMALIASYVRSQGYTASLVQYPAWEKDAYRKRILDEPALLYGFQVSFTNYPDIQELMTFIRESNPSAKFILGGPFVVSMYKEILKHDPNIDAAVLGEGEYTVIDIIQALKEGPQFYSPKILIFSSQNWWFFIKKQKKMSLTFFVFKKKSMIFFMDRCKISLRFECP